MACSPRASLLTPMIAALMLVLLGGCQSGSGAVPDKVFCYAGTSEVHLPGGRTVPGGTSFARRTLSPSKSTIIEEVVAPGRPGEPAREFVVDMAVKGNTLTMTERSGAFTGTGTLTGPAWAWTVLATESVLPGGMRVVSTDTLSGDTLTADKQVFGADGKQQVTITERYKKVSNAEFERGRAEMLKGATAASKPAAPKPQ